MADDTGIVKIHGKDYKTVAYRINEFRSKHPDFCIDTDLQSNAEEIVMKATISDNEGRLIASGYAAEIRDSTAINKTSALENCETSAIGRALSNFGLAGSNYASADELVNALNQQKNSELIAYNAEVRKHFSTIAVIKQGIEDNNLSTSVEAYGELREDEVKALWKATTLGGIFTTKERQIMRSDEWGVERRAQMETGDE